MDTPPLVSAHVLDCKGGAKPLSWDAVKNWSPGKGPIWVHLDLSSSETETWLRNKSGLDGFVVDGLLAPDARPRCDSFDEGILLVLRGVNLHPGADPEDMVSIRIWLDENRVISTRLRKLLAVSDITKQLEDGKGAISTGHLVARLAAQLTSRMGPTVEELGDKIADLEEGLLNQEDGDEIDIIQFRRDLIDARRVSIALRRYIAPQRDALNRFSQLNEVWLDKRVRGRLLEAVDRVTRLIEELDDTRERAAVVQDELASRVSHRMERTMYVLTIVSATVLPVGLFTGLLGINVGGMPGAENGWAFWAVCGGLVGLIGLEIWIFKKLKWI